MNRKELIAYGKSSILRRKIEKAKIIIEKALAENECWYVAFSGGKDSTVMLDLVRGYCSDIPAVWSDDEWWIPETMEYMERMKVDGLNLHQTPAHAKHTEFFTAHENSKIKSGREYPQMQGWTGAFIGIRADESNRRRIVLRKYGTLHYGKTVKQWQCYPLAWWTVYDIWAYILSRELDYNRGYDILEHLGLAIDRRRIGPLAVEAVLQYGQLVILKKGWPELYERFCESHPEARLWA